MLPLNAVDFSVVIPTYNGAERLPKLLETLRSQVQTEDFSWEVIVVDNNSQDRTAEVINSYQEDWRDDVPLCCIPETKQGEAFARQKGIETAQGGLVGFIDDDNYIAKDWVYQAFNFARLYPQAGAYGGRIHVDFETPPPENFNSIAGFFSARDRGDIPNQYQPESLSLPTGSAMVVRRKIWLESCQKPSLFIGRIGESMITGADWEPLIRIYKNGWEIWYNPQMHAYHQVPAWRLEKDYLCRLIHGACLSFFPLKMILAKPVQKPYIFLRTVLGNAYRASHHFLKYRRQLETDLVAACELQIYLSRIASPFYFFQARFLPRK